MTTDEASALFARVKAATGPDRFLDRDIERHFTLGVFAKFDNPDDALEAVGIGPGERQPAYSASIDAALALAEKLGWCVHMLHMGPQGSKGGASVDMCPPNRADENVFAEGATPPLAILAALLTALQEQKTP